jgi:glycosyltransferase involved in cell wall biosynthesis
MTGSVLVSIGLPVYNGEQYLERTLEATLNQTFRDFELIVSDNASTDSTAEICERFARADDRVRLIRQQQNVGVNANHAIVYREARGEYFRWANADDVPSSGLLEHAVDTLRRNKDVVVYIPDTVNVDADGAPLRRFPCNLNLRTDNVAERAEAVLTRSYQMVFAEGLIRRTILASTSCRWDYIGWDFVLLLELALRGQFANVEGPLLARRIHEESATLATRSRKKVRQWVDPTMRATFLMPHWRWTAERVRAVLNAPISAKDRTRVLRYVLRHAWWARHAHGRDVVLAARMVLGLTDEYPF